MSDIRPLEKSAPGARRLTEIRNLPVVSITDGIELGGVSSFLIDYERGRLAAFVLAGKKPGEGVRAAPFSAVSSFGSFAITLAKAADVCALSDNQYLLKLFEKDIPLLGSKVCFEGDDKFIGFVKDISVNLEDGALLLLTVTSDSGFTSPYKAVVPFSAVVSVTKDFVTLRGDQRLSYKKEGVLARAEERGSSFVPLVLEDAKWREILTERVREAMEKVHRELKDRFFADHEQFYLSSEKGKMIKEMTGLVTNRVEELYDRKFDDTARAFKELLVDTARGLTPAEKFEEAISGLSAGQDRWAEEIYERLDNDISSLKSAVEAMDARRREDVERLEKEFEARLSSGLESLYRQLTAEMTGRMDGQKEEITEAQRALEEKIESRVMALGSGVQELEHKLEKSIDSLRELLVERMAAESEARSNELRAEYTAIMEALQESVTSGIAVIKEEMEAEASWLREEIDTRLNAANEQAAGLQAAIETRLNDVDEKAAGLQESVDSKLNDAEKKTLAAIQSLREDVGEVCVNAVRHEEFAAEQGRNAEKIEYIEKLINKKTDEVAARIPALDPAAVRAELLDLMQSLARHDDLEAIRESAVREAKTDSTKEIDLLASVIAEGRDEWESAIKSFEDRLGALTASVETEIKSQFELVPLKSELETLKEETLAELSEKLNETTRGLEDKLNELSETIPAKDIEVHVHRLLDSFREETENVSRLESAVEKTAEQFSEFERKLGADFTIEGLISFKQTVFKEVLDRAAEMLIDAERRLMGFGEEIETGFGKTREETRRLDESLKGIADRVEMKISEISGSLVSPEALDEIRSEIGTRLESAADGFKSGIGELASELGRRIDEVENKVSVTPTPAPVIVTDEMKQLLAQEIERLKDVVEQQIAEIAGRKPEGSATQMPDIEAMIDIRLGEMREEILLEFEEGGGAREQKSVPAVDMDAISARVMDDVIAKVRESGLIKLMFDPERLAATAAGMPENATEEQIAAFIGSDVEKNIIGKRSERDIYTDDNFCIVKKGEVIDNEVIRRARDYGKFIELTLDFQDK